MLGQWPGPPGISKQRRSKTRSTQEDTVGDAPVLDQWPSQKNGKILQPVQMLVGAEMPALSDNIQGIVRTNKQKSTLCAARLVLQNCRLCVSATTADRGHGIRRKHLIAMAIENFGPHRRPVTRIQRLCRHRE